MSQLAVTQGSQYSDEQRREAMAHYIVTGNISRTAELVNIPKRTLADWKSKDWWVTEVAKIRHEKQDELDANISRVIDSATMRLQHRIYDGDAYIKKDGEVGSKPVSARDLATITGIMFDKRQIMRNLPTSIKAESTDSRLNSLADKVRELQGGMTIINGSTGQVEK